MSESSLRAGPGIRRAKRMLAKRCEQYDWYAGIGIVPSNQRLGLRVTAQERPTKGLVPETYYGYPVEVIVMPEGYNVR